MAKQQKNDSTLSTKNILENYFSGMSGLALPYPKYKFPEQFRNSSRLTYYSSLFNSIEINRSFYTLPNSKTVAKWSNEVPEKFRFTFKLWKQVTHAKGLHFNEDDVCAFMDVVAHVGSKRGCVLIQFPASVKSNCLEELERLLHTIQRHNMDHSWRIAIEFRDVSWYNEDVRDMVDSYHATIVVHDKSRAVSPHPRLISESLYIRFHGPQGDYRGSYTEAFLYEYAGYIGEWLAEGKTVFVYFNNTMGSAFENLTRLNEYVATAVNQHM